jgi:hypothetical protein
MKFNCCPGIYILRINRNTLIKIQYIKIMLNLIYFK